MHVSIENVALFILTATHCSTDHSIIIIIILRGVVLDFMCMSVLSVCMSVFHMHVCYPWKLEGSTGSSGTGDTESCEPPVGGGN